MTDEELSRLEAMCVCEKRLKSEGFSMIAGVDEAGRGPLAGPVVAAACILPDGVFFERLNDSKQLTAQQREILFTQITTHPGIRFGIGQASVAEIDRHNILKATFLAMKRAVSNLPHPPDYLLIDGNRIPSFEAPTEALVQGDGRSISIAAASILAKVTRDKILLELDEKWPEYGFKKHKGYGTEQHLEALRKYGPTPLHRKSFEPMKGWLQTQQFSLF